jgi:integrase
MRLGVRLNDPRVKRAPRPKRLWTMEQMHAFAAAAAQVRDVDRDEPTELEMWRAVYAQPMIRLLSDCGLRLGELPALERSDLRPGWLRVRQTAHESAVQPGTKTTHHKPQDEQWRDVPVPPSADTLLRAMPARIDTPLLFPTPRGRIWRERNWRRDIWAPAQNAMGIDPRPQEFRASWESILAGAGVDRADLGKYAGHSVQTANARYVQPLDRSAARVRSAIG